MTTCIDQPTDRPVLGSRIPPYPIPRLLPSQLATLSQLYKDSNVMEDYFAGFAMYHKRKKEGEKNVAVVNTTREIKMFPTDA